MPHRHAKACGPGKIPARSLLHIDSLSAEQIACTMRRVYDLVMTHLLDADDFFIHCVQRYSAEARLNFFLIEPLWVESFYEHLAQGKVWPRVLLNMHSE